MNSSLFSSLRSSHRSSTVVDEASMAQARSVYRNSSSADATSSSVRASTVRGGPPLRQRRSYCCTCPVWLVPYATRLLEHNAVWRGVMMVSALILLFMDQVHELLFPPASDPYIDVLYVLTFGCCVLDIVLRCLTNVDNNYCPGYRYWNNTNTAATADLAHNNPSNSTRGILPSAALNHSLRKTTVLSQSTKSVVINDGEAPSMNHHRHRSSGNNHNTSRTESATSSSPASCCGSLSVGSFLFWCDVLSTLTLLTDISFINRANFTEQHLVITLGASGLPIAGLRSVNQPRPIELNLMLLVTIFQSARLARFIRSSGAVKISAKVNWFLLWNVLNPLWWWRKCRGVRPDTSTMDSTLLAAPPSAVSNCGENDSIETLQKAQKPKTLSSYARVWQWLGRSPLDSPEYCRQLAATKIQRAWRAVLHEREMMDSYNCLSGEFLPLPSAHFGTAARNDNVNEPSTATPAPTTPLASTNNVLTESKSSGHNNAMTSNKRRNESQVGTAMRELTEQRVAIGIMIALLLTVLFTYTEENATRPTTMIVLHSQTGIDAFANKSLVAARSSSIPDLYFYQLANGQTRTFDVVEHHASPAELRPRERLRITIHDSVANLTTVGLFSFRNERREQAWVSLLSTIFILLVWFFGVTAFAGPVMMLVVIPIERMVRLLAMLMVDPLGYQSTPRYKRFVDEEDEITKNTRWTKEILKGMETSFLMSTILRIGSLMIVGFGSAGVEIIRNNLEKGQNKNMLVLSSQGSTVSCIFLFCDIRNFTDATECLQEEVFVFTNRIAAVVHSNCHSLGGSANKNVGDAFLLSWQLDETSSSGSIDADDGFSMKKGSETFTAKNNQADKALLAVVRICMALHYDDHYIGTMTETARQALIAKLKHRKGPIVQMGFGLHAGRAVQGAIGSQRKIDATYVSEAVERAEFLESSTKQYGLKMLMSDSFHRLLHPSNRRRCRKIDQILIREDDDDDDDGQVSGEIMDLFTFDLDVNALWNDNKKSKSETGRESDSLSEGGSKRAVMKMTRGRRMSVRIGLPTPQDDSMVDEVSQSGFMGVSPSGPLEAGMDNEDGKPTKKLVLPTGPALYNANVWTSEDMRTMRQLYSDGLFFQKFMSGLQSFYSKDWDHASLCFNAILQRFEDGPSRYFLTQIEKHNGKPPRDFLGYGTA